MLHRAPEVVHRSRGFPPHPGERERRQAAGLDRSALERAHQHGDGVLAELLQRHRGGERDPLVLVPQELGRDPQAGVLRGQRLHERRTRPLADQDETVDRRAPDRRVLVREQRGERGQGPLALRIDPRQGEGRQTADPRVVRVEPLLEARGRVRRLGTEGHQRAQGRSPDFAVLVVERPDQAGHALGAAAREGCGRHRANGRVLRAERVHHGARGGGADALEPADRPELGLLVLEGERGVEGRQEGRDLRVVHRREPTAAEGLQAGAPRHRVLVHEKLDEQGDRAGALAFQEGEGAIPRLLVEGGDARHPLGQRLAQVSRLTFAARRDECDEQPEEECGTSAS